MVINVGCLKKKAVNLLRKGKNNNAYGSNRKKTGNVPHF